MKVVFDKDALIKVCTSVLNQTIIHHCIDIVIPTMQRETAIYIMQVIHPQCPASRQEVDYTNTCLEICGPSLLLLCALSDLIGGAILVGVA